jgi:hypothetical protein
MSLQIIKAKPNPAGKDRIGNFSPQSQLAGEWIDIKNTGQQDENLKNINLYHYAYLIVGGEWEIVTDFSGILAAGKIMRIHSGHEIPAGQMDIEDFVGADYHVFSNKDYVWNNDKKDYPRIWNSATKQWIDKTYYDAFPPEGKILQRVNDKLI